MRGALYAAVSALDDALGVGHILPPGVKLQVQVTAPEPAKPPMRMGLIVPHFYKPTDPDPFAGTGLPVIKVIPMWLQDAKWDPDGGQVVRHIPTGFGGRNREMVLDEIEHAGDVDGIYFDEVSTSGDKLGLYTEYVAKAQARPKHDVVILSFGMPQFDKRYLNIGADIIVVAAGPGRVDPKALADMPKKFPHLFAAAVPDLAVLMSGYADVGEALTGIVRLAATVGVKWIWAGSEGLWARQPPPFLGDLIDLVREVRS